MAATPMPEALSALQSDAQVEVETEPWLLFRPVGGNPTVGLILYPGGRVDARAYAPTARALAHLGSLSGYSLRVTSIYGTRDGLATEDKIAASRPLLPLDTSWVAVEGGNHAQFGWYWPQSGDQAATISREE